MPNESPAKVAFNYIKSNSFRVAHVDGAIGHVTPAGLIFAGLYSERTAIPQVMVHQITEAGQVGAESASERLGKEGIVREVEVGAMMSLETATALVTWLQSQIELIQKLRESAKVNEVKDARLH